MAKEKKNKWLKFFSGIRWNWFILPAIKAFLYPVTVFFRYILSFFTGASDEKDQGDEKK